MDTRVIRSRDAVERRATARGVGGRGRPPLHISTRSADDGREGLDYCDRAMPNLLLEKPEY
ncbi:MAG: hypothetical protein ACXWH1_15570, partial [Thermoanaerobaculia bacterium]